MDPSGEDSIDTMHENMEQRVAAPTSERTRDRADLDYAPPSQDTDDGLDYGEEEHAQSVQLPPTEEMGPTTSTGVQDVVAGTHARLLLFFFLAMLIPSHGLSW